MIKRTLVLSAIWTLGIRAALLPSLACKSGAPPGGDGATSGKASPTDARAAPAGEVRTSKGPEGEKATPAEPGTLPVAGTTKPAQAEVPSSGRVETAAAPSGPERILPTTRRSAAGLPETLTGYISWFRLGRAPASHEAGGAHAPACQTYVLFPKQEDHVLGGTVKPPLEKGTTIVLEEKEPGKDFISRIRTMTVEDAGWKFLEYTRDAADKAFAARSGGEAQCVACHAKAKDSDSVYAKLKLE